MDCMPPTWILEMEIEDPEFMNYNQILCDTTTTDDYSINDSFSGQESYTENMAFIDQSFQTQLQPDEIKPPRIILDKTAGDKSSLPPKEPLIAAVASDLPSSNTFTICFGDVSPKNEILEFQDSLGCGPAGATKVPITFRSSVQAQDHVLAERKRREKLNRHFISLSSLIPNLKKMDKASVLEDASNYIKELQGRVKELEGGSPDNKRKNVHESVICINKRPNRRLSTASDDESYSSDETNSGEITDDPCNVNTSPDIEVRMLGSNILVRIQCRKNFSILGKALDLMQKLGLSIITSNAMPFAKTTLLISIMAQIKDEFHMTSTELMKNLQLAIL